MVAELYAKIYEKMTKNNITRNAIFSKLLKIFDSKLDTTVLKQVSTVYQNLKIVS